MSTIPTLHAHFVPTGYDVPEKLHAADFNLRMLTLRDVVPDYEAVMTSAAHLKTVFPGSHWPDGLTLEQNLIDLGWHQKEFQRRSSFAYTVVDPAGSRVLGCVYINPTRKPGYDAEVTLWARTSELGSGLEARLVAAVKDWIATLWPFKNVAFPGRGTGWAAFMALPDEKR